MAWLVTLREGWSSKQGSKDRSSYGCQYEGDKQGVHRLSVSSASTGYKKLIGTDGCSEMGGRHSLAE